MYIKAKLFNIIVFFIAVLLFVLSFQFNFFRAAPQHFYKNFQQDSESLVIGFLLKNNQDPNCDQYNFLGQIIVHDELFTLGRENYSERWFLYKQHNVFGDQYNLYINNNVITTDVVYHAYLSNSGFQGIFYGMIESVLQTISKVDRSNYLFIYKLISSFLTAILFGFFILFVIHNLGLLSAIITTLLLCISQWVIVFSNNLYWMFFLIIAPFCFITIYLDTCAISKRAYNSYVVCSLMFLVILIKSLSGYEYLSTIFISFICPFIFFAIRNQWSLSFFLKKMCTVSLFALLGFISAILIHLYLLAEYFDSYQIAVDQLLEVILKRTHGDSENLSDIYKDSLDSSLWPIIAFYFTSPIFNFYELLGLPIIISLDSIIFLMIFFSGFSLYIMPKCYPTEIRKNIALLITLWISIIAPLSWHILAKGHSYVHIHINHILWYLPFLLYGFAYIGYVLNMILNQLVRKYKKDQNVT